MAVDTLRAVIADDEAGAREHLRLLLEDCRVRTIDECATGAETIRTVLRARPHVVCLDIRMPDLDGLRVARELRGASAAAVVFTTGFSDYAADAFDLDAADYLLKPLSPSRVADAVRRVRARLGHVAAPRASGGLPLPAAGPPRLFIPKDDHSIAVAPDRIRMIEAANGLVLVHTDNGVHRLRGSLSRLERVLSPWGFLRTHRAYLVNLARVSAIIPWSRHTHSLLLDGGQETHVPVAKSRLAAFRRSVIWISHAGGLRSGPGFERESRDRGRREPGVGSGDRGGVGG